MTQAQYAFKGGNEDTQTQDANPSVVNFNDLIIAHENELLKYDNVSWKFKLYTVKSADYKEYQNSATSVDVSELIISETGATGKFNIDEVQLTTTAPGQRSTKNSTFNRGNITMSEQGSMTFFDDLQSAAIMLGYNQLMNIPLFLELTFVGYNAKDNNQPVIIPQSRKLWQVHMNKINTRLENTGSTTIYDIEITSKVFTPPNEWRLTEQVELVATRDVSTFIKEFSKKLNSIATGKYGYLTHMFANDLQPDSFYTFHVHPKVGDLVLINDSDQDSAKDKTDGGQKGSKRFTFEPKDTIANVIDKIMDSAQVKGVVQDTGQVQKRQFVHVIPVAKYVGYDRFRKKDVFRYDIYVVPYTVLDYQDVDDSKNFNSAFDLKTLLNDAHGTTFNMKRYDYQWSGLNNEILDLDMNFNHAYNMISGQNISSLYDKFNRKGVKTADMIPYDQIVSPDELQQLYLRKEELQSKASRTDAEERELVTATTSLNATSGIEGEAEQSRSNSSSSIYLENVKYNQDLDEYTNTYDGTTIKFEVPVDYENIEEVSSGTVDSNSSQTEVSKRIIRSNYYNDNFLLKLNLSVVGDPYWLDKSERDTVLDLESYVNTNKFVSNTVSSNNINCERCFLLNLHPAKGYDERTGLIIEDQESAFAQTVYRVNKITHTFNSKGFTQDLEASIVTRSLNRKK